MSWCRAPRISAIRIFESSTWRAFVGSGRLETSAGVARKAGEKSDESLSIGDCGDAVGRIGRHCLCADHAAYRASEDPDILDPTLARTYVGRIVFASFCDKLFD